MRKNLRRAAKVFTFLLCLSLLTGCSDNKGGSNTGSTTPTQATEKNDTGSNQGTEKDDKDVYDNKDDKSSGNDTADNKQDGNTADVKTDNDDGQQTSDDGNTGKNDENKTGNDDSGKSGLSNVPAAPDFKPIDIEYKTKDLENTFVPGDCTSIVFSEGDVQVVGKDTEISNVNGRQIVKIIKKGDYLISGSCSNGQIIVEANKEKDVRLILNGVNLTCTDSAPIYEKQCDKMVITLADGTENILSDTSEYVYDNVEKKQPDSVIFAKDDLVINGNGTLKVNSTYQEGIHSTDSVKLISGNIEVRSADNGIRGKEAVILKEPNLSVVSNGDSIKTTYSDNTSLGYIIIQGGSISLMSSKDGIQATGHIQITGGTLDITTDNGYAHADSEESKSAKGIKSDNDVYIKGASIKINSCDDAVNNNGNLIFAGGSLVLDATDDAIHADGKIAVNGGSVNVNGAKDGLEAFSINVCGGTVNVKATDNGIKASAEKDESDSDDKVIFGDANPFSDASGAYIAIEGGEVIVNTDGECLDSDGNLYITGGSLVISGAGAADGSAVSYKGEAFITGGSVEAEGIGDIKQKILEKTE